jgi:hypothetical protein
MKQMYLEPQRSVQAVVIAPCLSKISMLWGLYGFAMAMLWGWAHGAPASQAFVWAFAAIIGFVLLLATREAFTWNS